jgi:uncharacterized protein YegL
MESGHGTNQTQKRLLLIAVVGLSIFCSASALAWNSLTPLTNLVVCPGETARFSTVASGPTPYNFQWYKNGAALSGKTTNSLTISNVVASDAGTYSVVLKGGYKSVTNNATLTVRTLVSVTPLPNLVRFVGGIAVFTPSVSGTGPFTYAWKKNGTLINGQTGSSLILTNLSTTNSGTYSVTASGPCNSATASGSLMVDTCFPSVDVMLVIDRSGSMTGKPYDDARLACSNFVPNLHFTNNGDKCGLASYNASATLDQKLTNSLTVLDGKTSISLGLQTAQSELISTRHNTNALPVIILLSDGLPTAETKSNTLYSATQVKYAGTRIFTVGFGSVDPVLLSQIASSPTDFYYGTNSSQLSSLFTAISTIMCRPPTNIVVIGPSNQTVCAGSPATFSVSASGCDSFTYQWVRNGVRLAGQTNSSFVIPSASTNDAGVYAVEVGSICRNVTNSATLTVNQPVMVVTSPKSLTNCPGTIATFNVSAAGTGLSYQWYKGNTALVGRSTSALSLTNVSAADAGVYGVVVSGMCGNSISNIASLTVTALPIIACVSNKIVQLGTPWTFDLPTANYPIIVVSTVTNTAGHCGKTFAATRTWAAIDECNNSAQCSQTVTVVDSTPPIINCSNTNKTVELGTPWNFDAPTATDNSGTNITIMIVSTVTNTAGHCGNTFAATRTWAAIDECNNSAQCSQTVTVVDTTPPIITCSNTNKSVELGTAWTFDAPTATDNSGTNITIMIVSTVTNTAGHCGNTFAATRTWAAIDECNNSAQCSQTVTVVDTTPPIITCSNTNKSVELGTPWIFDAPTATDNSGTNITIMIVSTVTNTAGHCGGSFDATRTWAAIDECNNSAQCSQTVYISNTNPITILTPPAPQTNCFGTIANFNIVAQGTGLTYSWLHNGTVLGTNSTLSVDTSVAGEGLYTVIVTDLCNDAVTNSAMLVVKATTTISPLSGALKNLGDGVIFTTTVSGAGPFTYVWKKNGGIIAGATTGGLSLTNLTFADDADYAVEVTGSCNTAVQAAHLTVNHPPTVSIISPTNGSVFIAPATFTLAANAQDVDGVVTNITFFQAVTNKLGETTNTLPGLIFLTNQPIGSYTFTALAIDDLGARGTSAPVSVSVIGEPPLVVLSAIHLNPQTGLFEQNVRVLNPTYNSFYAVRVTIGNLTNGTVVYNPSGFTNGIAYVQSHGPVPAGSYVDFVIEYYIPSRIIPAPGLHAQLVPVNNAIGGLTVGFPQHIDRGLWLPNKTYLVEFLTISNRIYSVQYSSDLTTWRDAQPAIVGNGTRIQWIDNGQPKTETLPAAQTSRFYRVVLLP